MLDTCIASNAECSQEHRAAKVVNTLREGSDRNEPICRELRGA